jgi:deoxyribodipyrimidine photo-lyase
MPPPTIVWLRADLRLDDHEPFARAASAGAPVLPVYCVDPRQLAPQRSGLPRCSARRARFLLEGLADLRADLHDRGGDLLVVEGRPEDVIPLLVRETGALDVFFHFEVASEEKAVEAAVAAAITPLGARLRGSWGHTLYHVDDLPFSLRELPETFTAFRRQVERRATVRPPVDAPARLVFPAGVVAPVWPTLASLGFDEPADDARAVFVPRGGSLAAETRLEEYIFERDRLRVYKETRNGMLALDDSSKFSPWLAQGAISPRRIWDDVQHYEAERVKNESTEWLIVELLWRDYFRFVAASCGDALFRAGGVQGLRLPWRDISDHAARADFERWCEGTTGFPLVDAAMRELTATGFTSNRARQNVASFLTKNLGIDWRRGAEWFEGQLLDYDVGSNWGNWMYNAGVGHDARGFRFFNLHKQASVYAPAGDFVRHWIPELRGVPGEQVHRPELLSADQQTRFGVRVGADYPAPMVDLFTSARRNEDAYRRAVARA